MLNTEVVTGTACIFKWVDDESDDDTEYLWLGIVISVAEGSVVDADSKILVKWCPNDKKRTWRNVLSEDDTFDIQYSSRLQAVPYRTLIEKRNCIAFKINCKWKF